MIAPIVRVALQAAAGRSMRFAAQDAAMRVLLALGAASAVAVGAACLTSAAFILLERQLDAPAAWAIVGLFWGVVGLLYFAASRRRR
jgi:hypothetical protein